MKYLIYIFFLVSSIWPYGAEHDYHLTNIEVEYNDDDQALQMILKIFIDDLEDGIANAGIDEKLYLCTDRESENGDAHIYAYLQEKFKLTIDGEAMDFTYVGKETSEDLVAMYCYLEIENLTSVSEITISNDMLMELFDDQVNIIKIKSRASGKKGFMMLKKGDHTDTVQL